jgi:hypothetical protein
VAARLKPKLPAGSDPLAAASARGYRSRVADERGWAELDEQLPRELRASLEERFWRPIEAEATFGLLRDDPTFFADPGRHPAVFADHGVVHVRDVAAGVVRLVDTLDGVLLAARPAERRRFVQAVGVAAAYLHDIGMVDMSPDGRRVHAIYAAHAAFGTDVAPLVEHLAVSPVGARVRDVDTKASLGLPVEVVLREMLSMCAAHSKSLVPAAVLDDWTAFRRLMARIVMTPMDELRASPGLPSAEDPTPVPIDVNAAGHPRPDAAYAWLDARDGPHAELADDVMDAIRALRAADVLRQRGSVLRTSGGYEICFDARTANAVCTLRTASGDAAYLIEYHDPRGAGEANISTAFVTPGGDLRIAFHRGSFADEVAASRAAANVAEAVIDIQADVIPSFAGTPARGLPPPSRRIETVRVQLERPSDRPEFAEAVAWAVAAAEPSIADRVETVSDVEGAAPEERARFHAARAVDATGRLAATIVQQLGAHGVDVAGLDPSCAFAEVRQTTIRAGEVLVAVGSPAAFVYVPMGDGLVVSPAGGYAPAPLHPWVPVGTTGVIRRAERNSEIVSERDVDVVIIPAERYTTSWLRPLSPDALRSLLGRTDPAAA